MLWMLRLPAYRTAVVERTLGILLFSPEDGSFFNNATARRAIRSNCALGITVDKTALMFVLDVLGVSIRRDMPASDIQRVLLGLLSWPDHSAREHRELKDRIQQGDLGPDPVLTRFRFIFSYVEVAEALGSISSDDARSFVDQVLKTLADQLPDKVALKAAMDQHLRAVHERVDHSVGAVVT